MYCEIHYLGEDGKECIKKARTVEDKHAIERWCKGNGYEVLTNSMCMSCKFFGGSCEGTINQVWTGCIYRDVKR